MDRLEAQFALAAPLALAVGFSVTACSDDDVGSELESDVQCLPIPLVIGAGESLGAEATDVDSGYEACQSPVSRRVIVRREAVACAAPAYAPVCDPDAVDFPVPGQTPCVVSADCPDAQGVCVAPTGFGPPCRCEVGCTTDADCAPNAACFCDVAGVLDGGFCLPAECRSDADCPEGACGLDRSLGCGVARRLRCHTARDECDDRNPCARGEECSYDEDDGRWRCVLHDTTCG